MNEALIKRLRGNLTGRVISHEDSDYDKARTIFYGGFNRHPAAVIRVAHAADVSRLILFARETGLELAVRSGGHSLAGHSVIDGGLVLDLSAMKGMEMDATTRTAWAQTGLTTGEYTSAASEKSLATGFGDTGSVGIGGLTLGGGIGYLVRKHGLAIDNLLAAEIVTADGQLLQIDGANHPDLFWAIRGGGGNFGVVTRFKFRLHEVDKIVGGMLLLPATPEVIASFIDLADAAPEELSIIANIMPAPPMPMVPAEYHGKLIVMAMLVYSGTLGLGDGVVAPFKSLAPPIADLVKPMRYKEVFPPENAEFHPVAASRTMFLDSFDRGTAETIVDRLNSSTAQMRVTQLRVLGGAMARVPIDATAFAHRGQKIMVNLAVVYGKPEEAPTHDAWVKEFAAVLHPAGGAYVNFVGDEGEARVKEAYPGPTWDRLRAIKKLYDPDNLFRLNQNIPPA